jgi:hypothetical protein
VDRLRDARGDIYPIADIKKQQKNQYRTNLLLRTQSVEKNHFKEFSRRKRVNEDQNQEVTKACFHYLRKNTQYENS